MKNKKTYLMYDGRYFKIGSTQNLRKRYKSLKTSNPDIILVCWSYSNIENYLHKKYEKYRYKGEWFKFDYKKDQLNFLELWCEFSSYEESFPIKLDNRIFDDSDFDKIDNKSLQERLDYYSNWSNKQKIKN